MSLLFLDIFGIGIGLRYMNKDEYQTSFGVTITLLIASFLGVQIFLVGKEVINKTNPDVIFAERYVSSPARFNITRQNFNFAFGAQFPGNFSQFIDESIYTVTAEQRQMVKKFNQSSGEYYQEWKTLPVGIHRCTPKDFEVKESIDYFNTLAGIEDMYCLDYDSQDLFIEGNFDQDSFGVIQIKFRMCTGKPNCRKPEEIKEILTNSFVAHYTNDIIVDPKNKDPFQTISRDMYWNTNPIYPKDAYLYYRNIYFQTDNAIIFEEIETTRKPSLSFVQEQIIFGEADYYFAMFIRFEKAKESIYHRKYKKLDSILAEIGGIAKALVMIGFCICVPVNQLQLYNRLSNSLFKYQNGPTESILADKENLKSTGKTFVQIIEDQKKQINKQIDQKIQFDYQINSQRQLDDKEQNCSQDSQMLTPNYLFLSKNEITSQQNLRGQSETDKHFKKELFQKQNQPLIMTHRDTTQSGKGKKQLNTQPQELVKEQSNNVQMLNSFNQKPTKSEFNLFSVIKITKQMKLKSAQQIEIQQYNTEKEKYPQNIQQQATEKKNMKVNSSKFQRSKSVAKFKELLNQNGIQNEQNQKLELKWSDYIKYYLWPFGSYSKKRKQIDYSVEKIYQHLDIIYIAKKLLEFERVKQVLLNDDQRTLIQFFQKPLIDVDQIDQERIQLKDPVKSANTQKKNKQKRQSINMLQSQNKDEQSRAKEAYEALQNIVKKDKLSEIDKKILEMLDESILDNIHDNAEFLQQQEEFDNANSYEVNENRKIYQNNIQSFNNQDSNQLASIDAQSKKMQKEQKISIESDSNSQDDSSLHKQMPIEGESQQINQMPQLKCMNLQQVKQNSMKKI